MTTFTIDQYLTVDLEDLTLFSKPVDYKELISPEKFTIDADIITGEVSNVTLHKYEEPLITDFFFFLEEWEINEFSNNLRLLFDFPCLLARKFWSMEWMKDVGFFLWLKSVINDENSFKSVRSALELLLAHTHHFETIQIFRSSIKQQEIENADLTKDFVSILPEIRYPKRVEDNFLEYYKIGLSFRMNDPQATYFSCTACNYSRKETMDKTGTDRSTYSGLERGVFKKLGINNKYHPNLRRTKLKELAELLIEFENPREALTLAANTVIEDKINYLRKQQENELIVKTVRENPELLQSVINQIDSNDNSVNSENDGRD